MQKVKIMAEYNGEEFELIIGNEYEFSNTKNFEKFEASSLYKVEIIDGKVEYFSSDIIYSDYIRPIQKKEPKPLTADELYRICGKHGYEVQAYNDGIYCAGILCSYYPKLILSHLLEIGNNTYYVNNITHYRKAYSQDDWQPISNIEREEV